MKGMVKCGFVSFLEPVKWLFPTENPVPCVCTCSGLQWSCPASLWCDKIRLDSFGGQGLGAGFSAGKKGENGAEPSLVSLWEPFGYKLLHAWSGNAGAFGAQIQEIQKINADIFHCGKNHGAQGGAVRGV